jgi:hypothetical protein
MMHNIINDGQTNTGGNTVGLSYHLMEFCGRETESYRSQQEMSIYELK